MKKIKEYSLAWSINATALNVVVRLDIENGWQPYGSPFSSVDNKGNLRLYQAMVKYDNEMKEYKLGQH